MVINSTLNTDPRWVFVLITRANMLDTRYTLLENYSSCLKDSPPCRSSLLFLLPLLSPSHGRSSDSFGEAQGTE